MVNLPQINAAEDFPLHSRRNKLSDASRPFPAGFIPVEQAPASNRSEIQLGPHSPIFLPAGLRSPLPPSFNSSSSTLHSKTSSQARLVLSIRRLLSSGLLGYGPQNQHNSGPHSKVAERNLPNQGVEYTGPIFPSDPQVGLRSACRFGPKKINQNLPNREKHSFSVAVPPTSIDQLPKHSSTASKLLKRAKSIGGLVRQRNMTVSSSPSALHLSFFNSRLAPRLPKHPDSHEKLLRTMAPQSSSAQRGQPPESGFPSVHRISTNRLNHDQISAQDNNKYCRRPADRPFYIELESIEALEAAHKKPSSQENFMVSL